jgi:predicted GTPase/F0F1-type ATP synthase assembly protein I
MALSTKTKNYVKAIKMRPESLVAQIMAFFIVADKQIHSAEMEILDEYLNTQQFTEEEKTPIYAILGDKDDKPSIKTLFACIDDIDISPEEKRALVESVCNVIAADVHIDNAEKLLLDTLCKSLSYPQKEADDYLSRIFTLNQENKKERELAPRVENNTLGLRIRSIFSFGRQKKIIKKKMLRLFLQGPAFGEAIRSGSEIASHDLAFIEGIINQSIKDSKDCIVAAKRLVSDKQSDYDNTKEGQEFKKNISDFINILNDKMIHSMDISKEALNLKRRAMDFFTISFLGRTKAGKSTLHTILTSDEGASNAFIGKGSQRTTRFNRVYQWDNLRIIDTPGIGAPEEGGRSDEEIAKSIIDETDVVCYMVTSDNVQKSEFDFLVSIRQKNKPVIILLNVKNDFTRPEPLFKAFIQNPHYWAERTDEQNIQGNINHIKSYINALKDYDNKFVKIVPVQLLAAFLSKDEKFAKFKNKLYEGSHLDEFTDLIRESIVNSITIRRSQTIVDGIAYYIQEHIKDLTEYNTFHKNTVNKINEKRKNLITKIKKDLPKTIENCKQDMESLFEKFKRQINEFAENHYDLKKDVLQSAWSKFNKNTMRMEKNINNTINRHLEQEQKDIQEYLKDLVDDMESYFKYQSKQLEGSDIFIMRKAVSVFGTLVGAVGSILIFVFGASNPVGWIVLGVGILIGFLSNLFKNKEKKKQEAIDKLSGSLLEFLEENRTNILNEIPHIIKARFTDMEKKVDEMLERIEEGAAVIQKSSGELLKKTKDLYTVINKYYGRRILDYCLGIKKAELATVDCTNILVERNYGQSIHITTPETVTAKQIEKINDILQEKVVINQK